MNLVGSISGYSRPVAPVTIPPGPHRPAQLPGPLPTSAGIGHSGPLRVTPDHLALIRALLDAGQTTRALELLDAVWHPTLADEQPWYLRLWILVEQGRSGEALELARVAAARLPGSAAVAYLQAALEHAAQAPAALEAALRAAMIAPELAEPRLLLEAVVAEASARETLAVGASPAGTAAFIPSPAAAALIGAGLLFPLGSDRPLRPVVPPTPTPVRLPRSAPARPPVPRRFAWVAVATAAAGLWAVRNPLPAAVALGLIVLWLARPAAPPRSAAGS